MELARLAEILNTQFDAKDVYARMTIRDTLRVRIGHRTIEITEDGTVLKAATSVAAGATTRPTAAALRSAGTD